MIMLLKKWMDYLINKLKLLLQMKIKNEYKIGDIKKLVSLFCTVINKAFKICPIFIFYKRL